MSQANANAKEKEGGTQKSLRVLLVHLKAGMKEDGEASFRQRLENSGYVNLCGEVSSYQEIAQKVKQTKPDMVVVYPTTNISLGVLCQQIRVTFPKLVCLVVCEKEYAHWEPILQNIGIWTMVPPITEEKMEVLAKQVLGEVDGLPAGSSQDGNEGMAKREIEKAADRVEQTTEVDSKAGVELAKTTPTIRVSADQSPKPPIITSSGTPPTMKSPKHFITVYGPKGGVGKTFLSRELAVFFATQETNQSRSKVLAVDFNLDLGTFATSLNLARTPNLFTWVQQIDHQLTALAQADGQDPTAITHAQWQEYCTQLPLAPDEIANYIVQHTESGLHVLTSPRDIRHSFDIKDYHLYFILETLKKSDYDIILLDTAPDTTDATIQALFFAERVVMVGNPVVDAIENIQRMLKLLREADYPEERIQICINRLQRKEMFTLDEMRAYFQLHPNKQLYTIPDDAEVKRSLNTGKPLMLTPGKSPSKEAIAELARFLVSGLYGGDQLSTRDQNKPADKAKKGFSLFNLFS